MYTYIQRFVWQSYVDRVWSVGTRSMWERKQDKPTVAFGIESETETTPLRTWPHVQCLIKFDFGGEFASEHRFGWAGLPRENLKRPTAKTRQHRMHMEHRFSLFISLI
jgi:hypothetical protein